MSKKQSYITVTDQFCGAGGSSQGVRSLSRKYGGGLEVKLALNHWKLAIETHNTNFPDTLHDCTDVSAADPRRYHSTDILITSPECTNHSLAKGIKIVKKQLDLFASGQLDAAAERSRATMWDVCRFAEFHKYNAIIVENVVDARKWIMFDAWLQAMYAMDYRHKCVYINSMHCHPTPQSRDRMYIVFWKKGNRAPNLEFTPIAHCPKCAGDINAIQTWKNADKKFGKYRQQYVYCCPVHGNVVEPYYYAAFNCIDWSDTGARIGDRKIPLCEKTIERGNYGLDKYGQYPLIITTRYISGVGDRVKAAHASPLGTQPADVSHGVLTPFIIKLEHSQRSDNAQSAGRPMSTQNTRQSGMLISPNSRPITREAMTQTTCQGSGIIIPFITEMRGTSKSRTVEEPLGAVTAGGNHHGLVTTGAWNSFIAQYYNGSHCTKHISEEIGSVTTNDRSGLWTYQKPNIEDCYYRMLKPPEIKLAMAFEKGYIVLGNGRDQVKQLGNAVTPPAMEWLTERVIESLL